MQSDRQCRTYREWEWEEEKERDGKNVVAKLLLLFIHWINEYTHVYIEIIGWLDTGLEVG